MNDMFSLKRLGQVVVYAIVMWTSIGVLEIVWRRLWHIEMGSWESAWLGGALIALFIMAVRMRADPIKAGFAMGLVLLVYFLGKLLKKYLGG